MPKILNREIIKKIQADTLPKIYKGNAIHTARDVFVGKMDYMKKKGMYGNIAYYFTKNTPSYFEDNMTEWIEGRSLSSIEIDGITINQILSAHGNMGFLEALDAVIMVHNDISAEEVLSGSYMEERRTMFPTCKDICAGRAILIGRYPIDKGIKLSDAAIQKVFERLEAESCLNNRALFQYMMENCLPELEPNLIEWAKGEPLSEIMVGNLSANMLLKSWNSSELNYAFTKLTYYKKEGYPEAIEFHILAGWKY